MTGFVIDNAIDIPEKYIESRRVIVVPGTIRVGKDDLSMLEYDELLDVLWGTDAIPTVGIPPPARFIDAYRRALRENLDAGALGFVKILSGMLSYITVISPKIDVEEDKNE